MASESNGKSYFTWTLQMDQVLGGSFIEQMNQGNKLEGKCAWKPAAWRAGINALKNQLNISVTKTNIMSRFKTWGKHYDILHPLLVSCNSSAISWDHSKGRIEIHDENVWKEQLKANLKLAPYRNKILIENWEDICTLCSQDRANGEGVKTAVEANIETEVDESSTPGESFETDGQSFEDDVTAQQKLLKSKASPSDDSRARKRKLMSAQVMFIALERIADSFDRYLNEKTRKATTQAVLDELKKVDLDRRQMLKALDLMMHDQRLFDTFSGMPNELRQPWILMHLAK